ncbi:MAG: nth [Deferribacteraceae bacterium]|jgi:endonuclease-3|nr:nth [Deferribacteraceae bacterium]
MQQSVINKASKFLEVLDRKYPDATCSLRYNSAFELLVATILSAQCTDERVNKVTKVLFERYKTVQDFANIDIDELRNIIKPTGFYNNKAANIKNIALTLLNEYDGRIPENIDELTKLPGVGRKTANVILGNCFTPQGIVVDTHVKRVCRRIGLTKNETPEKIEQDLLKLIPKDKWNRFSHQTILFGRNICTARKPKCEICEMATLCHFYRGA